MFTLNPRTSSCGPASLRVRSLLHYIQSVPPERDTNDLVVVTTDPKVRNLRHSFTVQEPGPFRYRPVGTSRTESDA